ncbi:hypothetical protein KAU11_09910 [Candidatus Babeliales bacterium]|nr:hypothetical protein [Candidatus Babeliales bacterium]
MKAMFKSYEDGFSLETCKARFDAGIIERDGFGGFSKEYYNPFFKTNKTMDIAKRSYETQKTMKAQMQKASIDSQTGGAGTAGTALVPVYPDPNVVNRTIKQTPLRNITPRRAVRGLTYDYIPLTAKGGAFWAAENGSLSAVEDTYDRVSIAIKFLYAKGLISGPAIAGMRGFIDPTQLDLGVKTDSIYEAEEEALINGDASTSPLEPSGLIKTITTNTTNLSGGNPTLPGIRAELATTFNARGFPTIAVTDATTHNYVKGLLLDIQRQTNNPSEGILGFGIPDAFEFDQLMFIKDIFMPTTASAKRILYLDMRYIFFGVLQDLTYEEKYTDQDGWVYLLKEYLTVANTFEAASSQMYGIA